MLLEKWGIDPHVVAEADLNERGYYRFGATVSDPLLPDHIRGRRLERHWTAWPDEFPIEDFLSLIRSN